MYEDPPGRPYLFVALGIVLLVGLGVWQHEWVGDALHIVVREASYLVRFLIGLAWIVAIVALIVFFFRGIAAAGTFFLYPFIFVVMLVIVAARSCN